MIERFAFARTPRILFGAGVVENLPSLLRTMGRNALAVTGGSSFAASGGRDRLARRLADAGIAARWFSVDREPSPDLVDEASARFRGDTIDVVCAIGGGSVIDAGKAIAAMLPQDCSVFDYLEGVGTGRAHDGRTVPLIAVPTTAGTGSEATKNAVLSRVGRDGFKKSLRHDAFIPAAAVVDPELTLTCPLHITAASGMDALSQLLESYVSTKATPFTDALAASGLEQAARSLIPAATGTGGIEAGTGMSYAALVSGITLANAGLGVVHGFASSVGGLFDIPHGVVCGTLLGASMRMTLERLKEGAGSAVALAKFSRAGAILSGREGKAEQSCDRLVETLDRWTETLDIPRLGEYGVTESDLGTIIEKTGIKNNPAPLDADDLKSILRERI